MFETTGQFQISQAMTALQQDLNLLATWTGRFCPASQVKYTILINATTAGVRLDLKSGSRSIQPRGQVQGGGTAGTMPNPLGTAAIEFIAFAGEEIQALLYELLGGTPTVNMLVLYEVVVP